jgi:HK97 family phage major capsid protein
MTDPKLAPGSPPSDEETKLREQSAISAIVTNIVNEQKAAWQAEVAEELEKYRAPVTEVPDIVNANGDPIIKLVSPYQHQYDEMSDEEKTCRSPESDHWCAEWLRGQVYRDHGRMLNATAELERMYGRATTTIGVAAASGALSTGTGGPLIPRPLEKVVLINRDKVAKMRRWAQKFMMTAQTHTVPTAAAMTANMVGESTTGAQGEPTAASVQLTAKKGQVKAVSTIEALNDVAINLINLWGQRGGKAMGTLEDEQFFKEGDGTGNNISAFLAGTAFNETTSGVFAFLDMNTMYYTVEQQYRQESVWLISSNVLQMISLLRNATTGAQFYLGMTEKPGPITDDPTAEGTLFRRPVYEVPSTAGTIWFGDIGASYLIGDRMGLQSSVSDQVRFETDEVVWKLTQRFDGQSIDAIASQVATGITSVTDAAA